MTGVVGCLLFACVWWVVFAGFGFICWFWVWVDLGFWDLFALVFVGLVTYFGIWVWTLF